MKFRSKQLASKTSILGVFGLVLLVGGGATALYLGGFGTSSSVNLDSGLVGHWKMDDKTNRTVISDDFSGGGLDSDTWQAFGETHGSVSVNNNELTISNTSGGQEDFIGIRSQRRLPVGTTIEAKVRHTEGMHAGVVAFGESPFHPFPHGSGGNIGASIYSRGNDAVRSYRDESGNTDWQPESNNKLTDHKVKISRVDNNTVEYYINDTLVDTINQSFSDDYFVYFSANGHDKPNTMVIEWTEVTSPVAKDSTPSDNDGIVYGPSLTQDRQGNADSAYEFDGSTDSVEINPVDNFPSTAITTSFWVKTTDSTDGAVSYASNGHTNDWLLFNSGSLAVYRGSNGSIGTGVSFNDGNWHHIAVSWRSSDGQTVVYKDGQEVFNGTHASGTSITSDGCLVFAQEQDAICGGYQEGQAFSGSLDDIRIYDRVLSSEEVSALHDSQDKGSIQVSDSQKSLEGHWKMDGNAKDSTPQRNHGTVNGAILTTDRHNQANSSYEFDGVDDWIIVSDSFQHEDATITFWVKRNGNDGFIVNKFYNFNYGWGVRFNNGNIQIYEDIEGGDTSHYTTAIDTGWHHVAIQLDASHEMKMYIDGTLAGSGDIASDGLDSFAGNLYMGRRGSDSNYFNGSLDDVRVYSRILSANEIKDMHDSYNPTFQMSDLQKGLVGSWTLDGHAKDSTPYRNHGTLKGSPVLTADRHGRGDSAYEFDGTNDWIEAKDTYKFQKTDSFTITTWFYGNDWSSDPDLIGKRRVSANSWALSVISNSPTFDLKGDDGTNYRARGGSVVTGTWYHLAGVYDSADNSMTVYLDNSVVATKTYGGTGGFDNSIDVHIGRRANDNGRMLNGGMDGARIYDRALSSEEIKALHDTYR